jgi:hypothetical protein
VCKGSVAGVGASSTFAAGSYAPRTAGQLTTGWVWAECAKPHSLAIAARLVGAGPAAIAQVDQLSDEIRVG